MSYHQPARGRGFDLDLLKLPRGLLSLPIPLQAHFATDPDIILDELVAETEDAACYDTLMNPGVDI